MPAGDIRKKFRGGRVFRGSQVIFGERQRLREVLGTLQAARLPRTRKQREVRQLQGPTEGRTQELNHMNRGWDRRYRQALDPGSNPPTLLKLCVKLQKDDYLLARALTEHPNAPGEILSQLSAHPYHAVRENVARHPHTPPEILLRIAEETSEPLWFLVACNPSASADLRERLRARLRESAENPQ